MHRIDEIYTDLPYYGAIKITEQLKRDGYPVNHKRIERLMKEMGIEAIRPKKRTSIGNGLRKRGSFKKGNGSKKYKGQGK